MTEMARWFCGADQPSPKMHRKKGKSVENAKVFCAMNELNQLDKRKYYIDNVRWICILLLIPFHAAMSWNSWGEGNYLFFRKNNWFSSFIMLISPWYMPLLFVLAGMSARFALKKRSCKEYISERMHKLFVPLLTGIVTVVSVMAYYADRFHNLYQGNFFEHYGVFFKRFTDLTGYDGGFTPAHLWFLLYLFLISLLCLPFIMLQKKMRPEFSAKKIPVAALCSFWIITSVADTILAVADKSIAKFLVLFLMGYYVFSEPEVTDRLKKYQKPFWAIFLLTDITTTLWFVWQDRSDFACYVVCRVAEWFGILAILSTAEVKLNQNNKVTGYFTKRSFLIYIFHFPWLVLVQFYVSGVTDNDIVIYAVSVFLSFVLTLATIELVIRQPRLRAVFGIKKRS